MSLRILLALAIILLAAPSAPNDPDFDKQWALRKVGALCAWDRTTGSAEVIVAVVDSGVDPTHPDLVDRLRQMATILSIMTATRVMRTGTERTSRVLLPPFSTTTKVWRDWRQG